MIKKIKKLSGNKETTQQLLIDKFIKKTKILTNNFN